jgi:hypothetical protein
MVNQSGLATKTEWRNSYEDQIPCDYSTSAGFLSDHDSCRREFAEMPGNHGKIQRSG